MSGAVALSELCSLVTLSRVSRRAWDRALALSIVLPEKFGKPDFLFAPDPAYQMREPAGEANYVRPLMTIEPTAVRYQMPMQTPRGYGDANQLEQELANPKYAAATVFVAWEHVNAESMAKGLMELFHPDASVIPHWQGSDFDSLYVVRIARSPNRPPVASFILEHENLNGQSNKMPLPMPVDPREMSSP